MVTCGGALEVGVPLVAVDTKMVPLATRSKWRAMQFNQGWVVFFSERNEI